MHCASLPLSDAHKAELLRALLEAEVVEMHKILNHNLARIKRRRGRQIADVQLPAPMRDAFKAIEFALRSLCAHVVFEYEKRKLDPVKDAVGGGTQIAVETVETELALPSHAKITLRATTTPCKARDALAKDRRAKNPYAAITWTLVVAKRKTTSPEKDAVTQALARAGFWKSSDNNGQPKVVKFEEIPHVLKALWDFLPAEEQQGAEDAPPPPPKLPKVKPAAVARARMPREAAA